jgi:hypothetical protein
MSPSVIVCVAFTAAVGALQFAPAQLGGTPAPSLEAPPMAVARGTFDVKMNPQAMAGAGEGSRLARFSLEKRYQGDLEATAAGEMLAAGSSEPTSAGYVAVEEVRGTLHGRRGSFTLQHSGTMSRGVGTLTVTVVPDSGTEELAGLTGTLTILVDGKKHSYEFAYTLLPAR